MTHSIWKFYFLGALSSEVYMTYEEIRHLISESKRTDWLRDEYSKSVTLKKDISVSIIKVDVPTRGFKEDWTEAHRVKAAFAQRYTIMYNGGVVESIELIVLDDGRAIIPIPTLDELFISEYKYGVAQALDPTGLLDEYLRVSGISIHTE